MVAETSSRNVKVGDNARDFELPSLQGQTIKLSDYRGNKVILFMWASW